MNGWIAATLTSAVLLCSAPVHAHFKLLQPVSWLTEDELGAPQKGSPCGPGNSRPFIGDDVQPIPESGALTTFHAGEMVTVQLQETIYHPGYFRISIADTGAAEATSADFPDPALTDTENCHYDHAAVMTTPHGQVLGDGLFMASELSAENRSLMTQVKLPDKPCEHCTLQVVQVMEGHPASSCFYFHCAELSIVAADSGTPGAPAAEPDDGGCSVARVGARGGAAAAWWTLALAWALQRRRVRR